MNTSPRGSAAANSTATAALLAGSEADRPAVVVFEKRRRLTPELQRQFANDDVRVRSTTRLIDAVRLVEQSARPVLVFDMEADAVGCLQFLGRQTGKVARAPVVCVGTVRTAVLEWPARELGALEFLHEPIAGHVLANLCRRQWGWQAAR